MNAIDVIKTELACVQRDCCRVENQCAKCDLVLPVEEIISAYKKCISVLLEHEELEKENMLLGKRCNQLLKDKGKLTDKCKKLEEQNNKMKRCIICKHHSSISGCSYHSNWVKDCKENEMKLFELKEINEK